MGMETGYCPSSVSDTDMLFLGKGIGCATECYLPIGNEKFPSPYPSDKPNPELPNPTHGKPPDSLAVELKVQYRETCPNPPQTNSDSGSSGLSFPQLSSLSSPSISEELNNGNKPNPLGIGIPQGMIATGSPYIITPEPLQNSLVSLTPETSVGIDSPLVLPLGTLNGKGIFSRSIRKSPRDFKREVSEQ